MRPTQPLQLLNATISNATTVKTHRVFSTKRSSTEASSSPFMLHCICDSSVQAWFIVMLLALNLFSSLLKANPTSCLHRHIFWRVYRNRKLYSCRNFLRYSVVMTFERLLIIASVIVLASGQTTVRKWSLFVWRIKIKLLSKWLYLFVDNRTNWRDTMWSRSTELHCKYSESQYIMWIWFLIIIKY